jgi:hypothetical protein
MVLAAEKAMFLVRVDQTHYVVGVDGREVSGTDVPSCAQHLPYLQADRLCQSLRKRKFPAVVTDATGKPVTGSQLKPGDSLPSTLAEVDRIPATQLKQKMKIDASFRQRVLALWGGVSF